MHLDLTDANVVVARRADGSAYPDGVIDFGDLSDSWAVSELAITVSSVLGHPGSEPTSILPAVRAFHAIRPLTRGGGGRAVAAAGAAHRGADRQRCAAGQPRSRQRLSHRAVRRRVAHVRTGDLGSDRRDDRGDQGRPRSGRRPAAIVVDGPAHRRRPRRRW